MAAITPTLRQSGRYAVTIRPAIHLDGPSLIDTLAAALVTEYDTVDDVPAPLPQRTAATLVRDYLAAHGTDGLVGWSDDLDDADYWCIVARAHIQQHYPDLLDN